MADDKTFSLETRLANLAKQLEELIQVCNRLKAENATLRTQHQALTAERASLIEKNEQARARVEAMIHRLKTLEAG